MSWRLAGLFALVVALPAARPQENPLGEAAKYKILYAGKTGDLREKRFVALLKSRFSHVDSISLFDLSSSRAADYDVVVADWGRRYGKPGVEFEGADRLELNHSFSKPIVMIGAVGGEIQHHTKLDWL